MFPAGDAASTLLRKIAVFYGLKYIVEDSVVPQSGMFEFLCMDTLTDRIPTPKKSPFWYALWVYTNKRLFYMGN